MFSHANHKKTQLVTCKMRSRPLLTAASPRPLQVASAALLTALCLGLYLKLGSTRHYSVSAIASVNTTCIRQSELPSCPAAATPFPASFWYVKTHKTGSSTLAGVFRNICAHYGITTVRRDLLYAAQYHYPAQLDGRDNADMSQVAKAIALAKNASETGAVAVVNHLMLTDAKLTLLQPKLLFSSVRHPVSRLYSQFVDNLCWSQRGKHDFDACWFFNASSPFGQQVMRQDTIENRWKFVRQYPHDQSFKYMRGNASTVEEALDQYAFVFIAERMDESLVAFMLLYGLSFEDIAYLRSKDKTGTYKTAADMPLEMNQLIEQNNQLDIQLWQSANARLDAAINSIQQNCGTGHFERSLETFKAMQASIRGVCSDYKAWHERHGIPSPYTYVSDNGVGYRCVQHQARLFLRGAAQ